MRLPLVKSYCFGLFGTGNFRGDFRNSHHVGKRFAMLGIFCMRGVRNSRKVHTKDYLYLYPKNLQSDTHQVKFGVLPVSKHMEGVLTNSMLGKRLASNQEQLRKS